jgi:hypothetical protein
VTYRKRTTTTLTVLRVVEEFHDDEAPSLPGMPVVEAEGEDVTEHYRPLAKCGAAGAQRDMAVALGVSQRVVNARLQQMRRVGEVESLSSEYGAAKYRMAR